MAVTPVLPALATLAAAGAYQTIDVQFRQPLRHIANHLAQQISIGPFSSRSASAILSSVIGFLFD